MRRALLLVVVMLVCRTSAACPALLHPVVLPEGGCLPPHPSLFLFAPYEDADIAVTSDERSVSYRLAAFAYPLPPALVVELPSGTFELRIGAVTHQYVVSEACGPRHAARSIALCRNGSTVFVTIDSEALMYLFEWPSGRREIRRDYALSHTWEIEPEVRGSACSAMAAWRSSTAARRTGLRGDQRLRGSASSHWRSSRDGSRASAELTIDAGPVRRSYR